METNEFRVRAVTRYVVTHYYNDNQVTEDGRCGAVGCGPLGEFDHLEYATKVGQAMAASIPGGKFLGGPDSEGDASDF